MKLIVSLLFLLLSGLPAAALASPNALWRVVNNLCVFNQQHFNSALPCEKVNLNDGREEGYAIVRDFKHPYHFLLVPTQKIGGIESPLLLKRSTPDYFGLAWRYRTRLDDIYRSKIPRSEYGLAINSVRGRSQDQLHIHIACIKPNIRDNLRKQLPDITTGWRQLPQKLGSDVFYARRIDQEDLAGAYPFLLLKRLPVVEAEMENYGLAVVPIDFENAKPGFVLLATKVGMGRKGNIAHTEGLLDFSCRALTSQTEKK